MPQETNMTHTTRQKTVSSPLKSALGAGCVALLVVTAGACAPRVDNHGNQVLVEDVATLEPGQATRSTVLDRLGSPSSKSLFPPETWVYYSETTETTAFLEPEISNRQVIKIIFDEAGVVSDIQTLDETAAEDVQPAEGATPTAGNKLGFFDQILSNLGRFNKNKK